MFSEYDKVKIKSSGVRGTIVDISTKDGMRRYVVESEERGPLPGGYGDKWPLFDCAESDLEKV